jgi:transcriptional regulator with XRE-family HTH domain
MRTGVVAAEGDIGTLGARLLRARLEYGSRLRPPRVVTQTDVGRELGVSGVAVGGWEADRNEPALDKLRALAALYGVRVSWLTFGELPMRDSDEGGGRDAAPLPVTPAPRERLPIERADAQRYVAKEIPRKGKGVRRRKPDDRSAIAV